MIDVLVTALVMFLIVGADQLDYMWKERKQANEYSNDRPDYRGKHFAGGDSDSVDNRAD